MLTIFTGADTVKAKEKAMKLAKGSEVIRFGEGGEPFVTILGYLEQRGLFATKVSLFIDRPFEDVEAKELIIENAKKLHDAEAKVFIIQPTIDAPTKKKLEKFAEFETYDVEEVSVEPPPSVFALTDAFSSGNRKSAWILYRKLIESGSAPEEIHGALSWQARALVLASKTKSATESGLKPFVYSKAKTALSRFKPGEVDQLSRELMHMVHQSRLGGGDLEDLLEVFLLKKS